MNEVDFLKTTFGKTDLRLRKASFQPGMVAACDALLKCEDAIR